MNKQIEEMAEIVCAGCSVSHEHCFYLNNGGLCPTSILDCSNLYNAGYRKQSEGEWRYPPYAPFGGSFEMKRCSACGHKPDFDSDNPYTKFCPNCGARMKGE